MRARHAATAYAAIAQALYAAVDLRTNPLASHLLHDAARYDAWGRAIAAGRVFEAGAFSQAPLYPFVVGAIYAIGGPHAAAVIVLQVALAVASVALAGRAAARIGGETAGAWAAWLLALYALPAFYATKLLPAVLVMALTALYVERAAAWQKDPRPFAALALGGILGLTTIASAGSILLIVFTLAWLFPSGMKRAALCAAGAFIVIAPVTIRNFAASHELVPIATNGGITLWQGNNPNARGVYSTPDGFTGAIATQREEARAFAEAEAGRPMTDAAASRYWMSKGRSYLVRHPGLAGRKLLLAIASDEQPLEYSPRRDANPARWLMPLPFAALLALAIAGLPRAFRDRAGQPALLVAATTLATLLLFYVASRYRLPAAPALAVAAGLGAPFRQGRARWAALAVAAVSLAWAPLTQGGLRRAQDAMSFSDRATALRETGRLDDAIGDYRRAIALDPGYAFAHLDLAKALTRTGRRDEALAEIREAIRLQPAIAEAHFDLGVALFESGDAAGAAASFAEAFRLSPGDADAGNNLAGTYLKLGRIDEAREVVRRMISAGLPVDPPLRAATGL